MERREEEREGRRERDRRKQAFDTLYVFSNCSMISVIMTSRCLLLINIDWYRHSLCLWSGSKPSMLYFFLILVLPSNFRDNQEHGLTSILCIYLLFPHGIFQSRQVEGISSFLHPALHLCLSRPCQDNRLSEKMRLPLPTQSNGNQCQSLRYENTFLGENDNGALLHKYSDVMLNVFVSQRNNNMISLR